MPGYTPSIFKIIAVIDITFAVVKRKPEKKKKIRPVRDSNPMSPAIPVQAFFSQLQKLCL